MNKRGIFGRRYQSDKVIIEVSTVEEWARAIASEFGVHVTKICICKDDPPDCIATVSGKQISIELAELVDSNRVLECAKAVETGNQPPHHQGTGFEKTQWSKERFFRELNSLIDKKNLKYEKNKLVFDVLLIHTDEPWLSPQQAKSWLSESKIEPKSSFRSVYLLMTYQPGYANHWPVFLLFSNKP